MKTRLRGIELAGAVGALRVGEAQQARAVLGEETVVLTTSETPSSFRASIRLGLPRIDGLLREGVFGRAGGHREDRGIRVGSRARSAGVIVERVPASRAALDAAAPRERE